MNEISPLELRIAAKLKARRESQGLTLDQLSDRTGVSRAMISRIERQESSPTAGLLSRLCDGLDITISSLVADLETRHAALVKAETQPRWSDPATGFERRALTSFAGGAKVEIIHGMLPVGARIDYSAITRLFIDQHIVGLSGHLTFIEAERRYEVGPGDCLHCLLDRPHSFINEGAGPCCYLVILTKP